jgi:hypothetical protein
MKLTENKLLYDSLRLMLNFKIFLPNTSFFLFKFFNLNTFKKTKISLKKLKTIPYFKV